MAQADLEAQVLRRLQPLAHPDVLVGTESPDDAGVYRLSGDLAIVMTVDFFTPVVDDPRTYGAIAAANSLSDVYAMGGEPFAGLNIVGFPAASPDLPLTILGDILEGGADKAREAGVVILGGHTVDDPEPKYGLAVLGRIHPDRVVKKSGARPGDQLVLTKPLGTGVMTTALKRDWLDSQGIEPAVRVMAMLNRDACIAMTEVGAHAATDVTGFGLLGHLGEMLRDGQTGVRLHGAKIPFLDGARALAERGAIPGGTRKNLDKAMEITRFPAEMPEVERLLLADAQTSGGLLIAVAPEKTDALIARLQELKTPAAALIGEFVSQPGIEVS
ncbi:MAG TPA: selenide, water dikinase SelD [bacterium]|nr:selenide, water dikinase SelD [bacterium]